jgi:serine/threonine-protein kinase
MSSMPPPPPPPPSFPPAPPSSFSGGPSGAASNAAGFGPRFGAAFIDGAIGWVISVVLGVVDPNLTALGGIIGLAIYCVMVGKGQSIGQKATNIRIVDSNSGAGISAGKALGRRLVSIISALPCYLGFLWMLWDKDKKTWHDKIMNTSVVKA